MFLGNDASVVLVEGVAGSVEAFVDMMNCQAQAWGLKNTSFKNVTGITEAGAPSSTARDIGVIAARIVLDFPSEYRYYAERSFTYNKIKQDNCEPPARARPERGRHEDRLHRRSRLLPGGQRPARVPEPGHRAERAGQAAPAHRGPVRLARRARHREPEAAELGIHRLELRCACSMPPRRWPRRGLGRQQGSRSSARQASLFISSAARGPARHPEIDRNDPLVAPLEKGQRVGTIKVSTAAGTAVAEAIGGAGGRPRGRHHRPRLGCTAPVDQVTSTLSEEPTRCPSCPTACAT